MADDGFSAAPARAAGHHLPFAVAALALFVMVLAWGGARVLVAQDRGRTVAEAMTASAGRAQVLAERTARTVEFIDGIVLRVKAQFEAGGRRPGAQPFDAEPGITRDAILGAAIINERGEIVAGRGPDFKPGNAVERGQLALHAERDTGQALIGKPLLLRVTGQRGILISRRLNKSDGSFFGMVAVAVDPDYFTNAYRQAGPGQNDVIELVGVDGVARARLAGAGGDSGQDGDSAELMKYARANAHGGFAAVGKSDGVARLYGYRTLREYPLIVSVGVDEQAALAGFTQRRTYFYAAAAAASLAALGAAWWLMVFTRRRSQSAAADDRSNERYRQLGESSPDAMLINRGNEIIYANAAALKLLGASAAHQVVGHAPLDFVHVDDLSAVRQRIERVTKDGRLPGLWEQRFVRLDGSIVDVEINVGVVTGEGLPSRQVVIRDISARKRMEEQLRQSEARYRKLVEASPDATFIIRDVRIDYANSAALQLLGAGSAGQIVGKSILTFVHPDQHAAAREQIEYVQRSGHESGLRESRYVRLDGSVIDVEISATLIIDQGSPARHVVVRDVSARKRVEQALRLSEERYRMLVESSPDATLIYRGDIVEFANAAALRLFGAITPAQIVGHSQFEFMPAAGRALPPALPGSGLTAGQPSGLWEQKFVRLDGSTFDGEGSSTPIVDQRGAMRQVILRDFTARKLAEVALSLSEERYRTLVETSPDATFISRGEQIDYANAAALRLLGATVAAQVIGRPLAAFVHAEEQAAERERSAQESRAGVTPGLTETRYVRLDGSVVPVEISTTLVVDQKGSARHVVARDITRRREAELKLEASRRRHRELLEGIPDVAYLKDRDGRYIAANRAWSSRHGIPAEQIFGKTDAELFPAARAARNIEEDQRVMLSGAELRFERPYGIDGDVRWFETIKTPITDEHKTVTGTVGISRDITERRRAEAALRESEARLQAIMDNGAALISLRDLRGRYLLVNRRYAELLQLTPDQFAGKTPAAFFPAGLARQLTDEHQRVLETCAPATSEVRVPTNDGVRVFISNKFALLDAAGAPYAVGCVGTDITQHERDAETLRHVNEELSQKAAELTALNKELEAFSYSVSHDLRAPLRHIDGFVNMLRQHAGPALDDAARHYMLRIEGASSTMTRLIDDLLTFSRAGRGVLNKIPIALDRMIADIIDDLKPDIAGRRVDWSIGALPVVHGDRNLLRQVFFNLLENAVKYTRPRDAARIDIACAGEGTDVIIAVRDNGVGFDMQYAHKLFGVFQRLHSAEEFEGTGIGLANVARIIQRHGGRVWAEGTKGRGAAFFVALPSQGIAQ